MKLERIYVYCNSAQEKNSIAGFLDNIGYFHSNGTGCDNVSIGVGGEYWFSNTKGCSHQPISFDQFMQKYGTNTMKEKINQALTDFKFNKEQLSVAIGMSKPYISKMLTLPQSKATQKKVIGLIDKLYINTDSFNKQSIDNLKDENQSLKNTNNDLNSELNSLRKTLEHKDQVLDKRNDLLQKAEYKADLWYEKNKKLNLEKTDLEKSVEVWEGECFYIQSDLDKSKNKITTLKNQHQEKINKIMDGARVLKKDLCASKNKIKNERIIFVIVFVIMSLALIYKVVV